jgi:uridine kinase
VVPPYLIAVAGPSCSGKSELSKRLQQELRAPVLGLDSYYLELAHLPLAERARMNFDKPAALDGDLLIAQVRSLAEGRAIERPVYDFSRHTRSGEFERIEPGGFVIVEGLLALHWPELRALYGTKVFIDADDEVCYRRRLDRDIRERGRTPESVHFQYYSTVRPMAERYILPTRAWADLVVSGVEPLERSTAAVLARVTRSYAQTNSI